MGNITLPPQKKILSIVDGDKPISTEKKILEVINKGGSPTKSKEYNNSEGTKQINVQLLVSEIEAIRELREKRPRLKRGGKRLAISLHDWIVEAVQEKINRDNI